MKDLIKIIDASVIVFVFTHIFAAVGAIEAEISNFEVSKIDHSQSFALCMRKVLRKVLRKTALAQNLYPFAAVEQGEFLFTNSVGLRYIGNFVNTVTFCNF
jgi:hypothetical protein